MMAMLSFPEAIVGFIGFAVVWGMFAAIDWGK